jgi:hypothetical protein
MTTITSSGRGALTAQGTAPLADRLASLEGLFDVAKALHGRLVEFGSQRSLTPEQLAEVGILVAAARPHEKHYRGLTPVSLDLDTSLCPRKDIWSRLSDFVAEARVSRTLATIRSHAKDASGVIETAVNNASYLIRLAEGADRLGLKSADDARAAAGKLLNDAFKTIIGFNPKDSFFSVCVMERLFPTERPAPVLGPDRDEGAGDAYGPGLYGRDDS